jgi:hypothetical protein
MLLYSHNTFLFLQNDTLLDFQDSIHAERFASLRSIHLHWQYDETCATSIGRSSTRKNWSKTLSLFSTSTIPQLDHIVVYIQGTLYLEQSYRQILSDIKHLRSSADAPPPSIFVLRLPPIYRNLDWWRVKALMSDPSLPFRIVGPGTGIWLEMRADGDHGWRHGVAYLPPDGGSDASDGFVMRRYTVWIPSPWRLT